jgi:hypothetical protein
VPPIVHGTAPVLLLNFPRSRRCACSSFGGGRCARTPPPY